MLDDENVVLDLDPETINKLASLMADSLVKTILEKPETIQQICGTMEETTLVYYSMSSEDAIRLVSLDLIASYTAGITDPLGQLRDWFTSIINSIASWIVSGVQTFISQYVIPAFSALSSGITYIVYNVILPSLSGVTSSISGFISNTVIPAISGVYNSISNFIQTTVVPSITGFVQNVVIPAINTVSNFISQTVVPSILNVPNTIMNFVSSTIIPAISGTISTISGFISGTILPAITNISSTIYSFISQSLIPAITTLPQITLQAISSALSQASQMIVSGITGFINQYVRPAINLLSSSVQGFVSTVLEGVNKILSNVTAGFQSVANIFTGFVNALLNLPSWFMDYIVKPIGEALSKLGEWIWNALPDWLKNALSAIGNFFTVDLVNFFTKTLPEWFDSIAKGFQDFLKDPLGWLDKNLVQPLMNGLKAVGDWIWNALPQWLKDALTGIVDFFTKTLPQWFDSIAKGFQDFFADPLGWLDKNLVQPIMNGLKAVGDWIWNALPDWLKGGLTAIGDFFKGIADSINAFIKNPVDWLNENIVKPVINGAQWLWEQLQNIGNMIWNALKGAVDWLVGAVKGVVDAIVGAVSGLIQFIYGGLKNIADAIGNWLKDFLLSFKKAFSEVATGLFITPIKSVLKSFKIGTPQYLSEAYIIAQFADMFSESVSVLLLPFYGQLIPRLIMRIARSGAQYFKGLNWKWHLSLKPIGIGIETDFDIGQALGASLYEFGKEGMKWLDEFGRALTMAMAFPLVRPPMRLLTYSMRNFVPVEIPPTNDILEFTRRMLPHKLFSEIINISQYFLALYGYSDAVLWQYFTEPEKLSITVKDRFGNDRTVPLSLLYELPSASDVATMMVRDIFPNIEEFKKLYLARGMHPDVGALYYLLRFRYPPPEKLWQFTTRGIAGFLWARIPKEEAKRLQDELTATGAYSPKSAVELNKAYSDLFNAYATYMKWHDFFRGSWIEGFTSDNQIMTDVQADIPTKIDARWMVRHGIFELLKKKDVAEEFTVQDFRTKIIDNQATSKVEMDLRVFSRMLQATGLHPDLVPITAVAEAVNAVADERNMLRTASINMFKEGFFDIVAIDKLLGGAITVSFQVSAFNMEKMTWESGYVNLPLIFLPPEAKLIELRASLDRALDILREIQRDITTGYQEYIIVKDEDYMKLLEDVINSINVFYAKDFEAITGYKLPDDARLKLVKDYYEPYIKALSIYREIHITRRIRAWTQRWLGWIMYRVATGVASLEDTEKLITLTATYSSLSPRETEFLQEVMKVMNNIATREYIPTPSQLLTMSEYIKIPDQLIDNVFQKRFIESPWKEIWKQYIKIRTIADDVKSLISTYMYVLRYVNVKGQFEGIIKHYASMIGFSDEELKILDLRAQLEEVLRNSRENVREYIPSPLTLASIAEILPEARSYFEDVVKAKNIPENWRALWARYVDIKPLVNDVRTYLARAEQLYAKFMIPEEEFKKVLDQVKDYLGYTDKEIEFLLMVTRYERHRTAWTELIGDVDRMVMLAEYSPRAREFALGTLYKMIDALPIDQNTKNVLKEMWEQFIRVKPVIEEVKRYVTDLINAYVDGSLTDTAFSSELEALKEWGLDDYEIMFYKAIASMRKARKLKITLA